MTDAIEKAYADIADYLATGMHFLTPEAKEQICLRLRELVEEENAWRPIESELPPLETPVWLDLGFSIIIGGRTDDGDGWLWYNAYGSEYYDKGKCRWRAHDKECDDMAPKNWRPLPDPPRERRAK